jgi:hypothetical protein
VAASDNEWGDASGGGSGQRGGNTVAYPAGGNANGGLLEPVENIDPNTGLPAGTPIGPARPVGQQPKLPVAGAGGGPLSAAGYEVLTNDPTQAWKYLLRQAGIDPNRVTKFSNYAKELLSPALSSYLNARRTINGTPGATDQIPGYLGDFAALLGGNNLFGGLAGVGKQGLAAGQGLMDTAQPQDAKNFFLQMLGLEGLGAAPLQASAQDYLTKSLTDEFDVTGLSDPYLQGADKFGSYAQGSGYYAKLKQLGLVP